MDTVLNPLQVIYHYAHRSIRLSTYIITKTSKTQIHTMRKYFQCIFKSVYKTSAISTKILFHNENNIAYKKAIFKNECTWPREGQGGRRDTLFQLDVFITMTECLI